MNGEDDDSCMVSATEEASMLSTTTFPWLLLPTDMSSICLSFFLVFCLLNLRNRKKGNRSISFDLCLKFCV